MIKPEAQGENPLVQVYLLVTSGTPIIITEFEKISSDMGNRKRVEKRSNVRRRQEQDKEICVLIPLPPPCSIPLLIPCPAESVKGRRG